jgi:hypothetical protein
MSQLKFAGEILEKIVFEKCSIGGKGNAAVVALTGAIDDLRNSIDYRNNLILDFRATKDEMSELQRIQLFVGAAQEGEIDNRFQNNVLALSLEREQPQRRQIERLLMPH